MWPFKKSSPVILEPEQVPPIKIGERFKYLGVEMICSRHYVLEYPFPVIVAEYVTTLGEIKQVIFCPVDWTALTAELVR